MTLNEYAERVAALEVQVKHILDNQDKTIKKLDDLLALRNKGVGVFWLMSMVTGTGIIGTLVGIMEWIKHI